MRRPLLMSENPGLDSRRLARRQSPAKGGQFFRNVRIPGGAGDLEPDAPFDNVASNPASEGKHRTESVLGFEDAAIGGLAVQLQRFSDISRDAPSVVMKHPEIVGRFAASTTCCLLEPSCRRAGVALALDSLEDRQAQEVLALGAPTLGGLRKPSGGCPPVRLAAQAFETHPTEFHHGFSSPRGGGLFERLHGTRVLATIEQLDAILEATSLDSIRSQEEDCRP